MIYVVYTAEPIFPATEQQADAVRAQVGTFWVDYTGTLPTLSEVNAFLHPPVVRPLLNIVTDINALSGAKKTAIWSDITGGTPPKWALSVGPNSGAIAGLATTIQLLGAVAGVNGTDMLNAKIRAVATYILDNPLYLVAPSFDPTINIPGKA